MKATYVPPVRTPAPPDVVSVSYRDAIWEATGIKPEPECVAVLHAHGALETGHFDYCICNAPGNIKSGPDYEGFFTCYTLNEKLNRGGQKIYVWFSPEGELTAAPSKGGALTGQRFDVPNGHPQTRMRAFATLADGLENKIKFLLGPRWIHCLDYAHAGDPHGYVEAIRDQGYFTADLQPYAKAVFLLYKKFLPIAQEKQNFPTSLQPHQEQEIEDCIEACIRVDRHVFWPDPNWEAVIADRDRDILEGNH